MKNKLAKISSVSFALMLVFSIVSFAFIIGGGVGTVSGKEDGRGSAAPVVLTTASPQTGSGGWFGDFFKVGDHEVRDNAEVKHLFTNSSSLWGVAYLLQGLQWATIAHTAAGLVGGLFMEGKEEELKAVQQAVFAGIMAGSGVRGLIADGGLLTKGKWFRDKDTIKWLNKNQAGISLGVGALVAWAVYTSQYKKTDTFTETVNFQCMAWQAPRGGQYCELCNDGELPCSEYRCKSLGQACGLKDDLCMNMFRGDTNPPVITPWEDILTEGFRFVNSHPMIGVEIENSEGLSKCIRPFTPIEFGILTDEPSQCKIDLENKKFDEMSAYFGGESALKYNHTEYLSLPNMKDIKNSSINIEVGTTMNLYVRCMDAMENVNEAPYVIRFCVDDSPDTTAPKLMATSIETNSCVASYQNSTIVDFYLNEPSQCKWGFDNQAFDSMPYNMSCSLGAHMVNSLLLYTCTANLTSVARSGTKYYVRCEDQPNAPKNDRIRNEESIEFSLKGSNSLKLEILAPNETIYGGVSPTRVELKVKTSQGCDDHKAVCFFSEDGNPSSYVMFANTNADGGIHTQMLDLYSGEHKYFVKCVDAGGNVAESNTTFMLDIDNVSPVVARAYIGDSYLSIVTFRKSTCKYTTENCDFLFDEGQSMSYPDTTFHLTPVKVEEDKTYYIKCRDEFRNEPADCSIIVKPVRNFLSY